jgi:hypothetical protein
VRKFSKGPNDIKKEKKIKDPNAKSGTNNKKKEV